MTLPLRVVLAAVASLVTAPIPCAAAVSPNWRNPGGNEPILLYEALRSGELDKVHTWLDEGLKVDQFLYSFGGRYAPLMFGVLSRNAKAVQFLLDAGADPAQMAVGRDGVGETYSPLMFAAAAVGSTEIISLLIDKGADINARGQQGVTALMVAAGWGQPPAVSFLLERGSEVDGQLSRTASATTPPIHAAVRAPTGVQRPESTFIAAGGATALWLAAAAGHRSVVEILVAAGADRTIEATCPELPRIPPGEKSSTAARVAELLGRTEVVQALGAADGRKNETG